MGVNVEHHKVAMRRWTARISGKRHRAVAAQAHRESTGLDDAVQACSMSSKDVSTSLLDRHVAEIHDIHRFENVGVGQRRIVRSHECGLLADRAGPWREPMRVGCVPQSNGTPRITPCPGLTVVAAGTPINVPAVAKGLSYGPHQGRVSAEGGKAHDRGKARAVPVSSAQGALLPARIGTGRSHAGRLETVV